MKKAISLVLLILTSSFIACDSNSADNGMTSISESNDAIFTVEVDGLTLDNSNTINVTVEIKALEEISRSLPTTSYGAEGVIQLSAISIYNPKNALYTNLDFSAYDMAMGGAYLDVDETLSREFQLFADPIAFSDDGNQYTISPEGTYRIYVKLFGDEEWVETDIVISVNSTESI